MTTAIRATKLYLPRRPTAGVARPRLMTRLDEGLTSRLTVLSAPAGFGKTTAVSEWAAHMSAGSGRPVAWLSLEESDDDPARFVTYLVSALRTVAPDVGAEALRWLESSRLVTFEPVLTALVNDIAAGSVEPVLVLDDYHVVDSEPVAEVLAFLVEHLPPQLHIVITTREDPRLPLSRLRARGQLAEMRAADLRFTPQEATEFLVDAMGLDIAPEEAARLESRTEGWIAGLQLAALSLKGRQDAAEFIDSFTGSHRFVLDYLVDEVLQRQPQPVRDFLLRTCFLDRLTGPLCDAVTGGSHGAETLAGLERANLFLVPLDDHRRWYRYHHLFRDVLRSYAGTELRDALPNLHRRASEWHEAHGSVSDAISHALTAADTERAADLIERATPMMRQTRQGATLLRWIETLPVEEVRRRPMLSVGMAATLLDVGRLDAVEEHLAAAERWLESAGEASTAAATRQLPGLIAMHRAGLALVSGEVVGALQQAALALDVAPVDDKAARGGALGLLGLAYWSAGDLEAAHATFSEGMTMLRAGGFVADAISGVASLADVRAAQGRLNDAISELDEALKESAGLHGADPRGALDLHVAMSELLRERNELDDAARHLHLAWELGELGGWTRSRSRWCAAMALVSAAKGDQPSALDLSRQAVRAYVRDFFPDVRPVAALEARMRLAAGRLDEASDWVSDTGSLDGADPEPTDPSQLSYLREYRHITAARVLLATFRRDREGAVLERAGALLDRLLRAAEAGGRWRSVIEILILQALTAKAEGEATRALEPLARALALAEPEGLIRVFMDEGSAMEELLRRVEDRLPTHRLKRFCHALRTSFSGRSAPTATADWLEPLTDRELEVLRLIGQGLSNRAIAQRLFRAESTIKGQNRVIFEKLQVQSRTEAIARARELGLL